MSTSYDSQANSGAATLSPQAGTVEIGEAATAAANPQANGVSYGAFSALVVPTAGNFVNIYDGGGDVSLTFYQYRTARGVSPFRGASAADDDLRLPCAGNPHRGCRRIPSGRILLPTEATGGRTASGLSGLIFAAPARATGLC